MHTDKYTQDILRTRFYSYKKSYIEVDKLKKSGLKLRQQNPPEDITENIVKYIIRNYDNDNLIVWGKEVSNKLSGDLYSPKYEKKFQPEVKSFTSNGPIQFGPNKKFGVLYFLDLRNCLDDKIILYKLNLTNESPEYKNININKSQTHNEQCIQKRRPHISWDKLHPQINKFCTKIYDDTFENIFNPK